MKIKFGTNRIVIIGKRSVYKFPIGIRGFLANRMEYHLSKDRSLVAATQKYWWGLKQERLWNTVTYPYQCEHVLPEHQELYEIQLHNRLQVGQDINGIWKIFDYEDVKYKPSDV
nr:MAG TPA: hypothetical protein [Caudoviricetes sp.]